MTIPEMITQRMSNQQIDAQDFAKPVHLLRHMVAVQAQDYGAAKWALGLRLKGATDNSIEQAFNNGDILRTHLLRPTWHFVLPEDIRFLLKLTAPQVNGSMSFYNRKLELTNQLFDRCNELLAKALQGNKYLTREELSATLARAGIATHDLRDTHIIMRAELDGIICSGPRRGNQFTYALLDERVPQTMELTREDALIQLTKRYFRSRGPATLHDYAWWSGLSVADAKHGVELVKSDLTNETVGGKTYWFAGSAAVAKSKSGQVILLPNFDEYMVSYQDRSAIADVKMINARDNVLFSNTILINGRVEGTWKKIIKGDKLLLNNQPFHPFSHSRQQRTKIAARRYARFLGRKLA